MSFTNNVVANMSGRSKVTSKQHTHVTTWCDIGQYGPVYVKADTRKSTATLVYGYAQLPVSGPVANEVNAVCNMAEPAAFCKERCLVT